MTEHAFQTEQEEPRLETPATCLFGRDEMNLIEFPFGPIKPTDAKTLEVEHEVIDRKTKRPTKRTLTIIGSDAFGLPTPVDERVLLGLKAITQEAGFKSRKVYFSRYHLCRTIGWKPDGRVYRRIEESLDRIAGTTLKFKNAWWDKGENTWRSHTFHLLDNVELCSAERYQQVRKTNARRSIPLNSCLWNQVVFKSFQDGYIRSLDMNMIRKIGNGRRREVPLRLYRWLAKHFYKSNRIKIDVVKLGHGTLGLTGKYPSEYRRVIQRAAEVLIDCKALGEVAFEKTYSQSGTDVVFQKKPKTQSTRFAKTKDANETSTSHDEETEKLLGWFRKQRSENLIAAEKKAFESNFGLELERNLIQPQLGSPFKASDQIRIRYVLRYLQSASKAG